jgi:aryl sulfotransferase
MSVFMPEVKHVYQNHHLDSTRWDDYVPRDDDIIIATSIKSGTTWLQTIVMHLIFQDLQPRNTEEFSPWIEIRLPPRGARMNQIDAQKHRRFIKTHLPLDGLPYCPQVKYIVVGRDIRDVGMSLWNHYGNYTTKLYQMLNESPGRVGPPLPPCPETIHEFWRDLMTRGWFDWENEGYPFWSVVRYMQTWWDFKDLDNILFVHFNDLLQDLEGEIQRIANYLNIRLAQDLLRHITDTVTFKAVKQNAGLYEPDYEDMFKGGAQTFFNKGTNGRWRDVLTEDELKLYQATVARELSSDCARWLESGRLDGA